jgi:predicted RNase H-like HicB family nuclease
MVTPGTTLGINLSAIVYREDGVWIAHCLELDIVSEGKDADDALKSLVSLCDLQISTALKDGDLESIFRPAPPEVWKMFSSGREKFISDRTGRRGKRRFRSPVQRFEARELLLA